MGRGVYATSFSKFMMRASRLLIVAAAVCACARPATLPESGVRQAPTAYRPSDASERELLPDEQVQQVLNRLAFGARPGDATKVRAMGVDAWIQMQLNPASIVDTSTDRLIGRYASLTIPTADLVGNFRV